MSGAVTPTSPKAVDAGLPAYEAKHAESSTSARSSSPDSDTLSISGDESSGIFSCLESLAYSVWSCMAGFFRWIGSMFGSNARNNPELLKEPLKQIAPSLEAWKNPDGPIKLLCDKVHSHEKLDQFVKFSARFQASEEQIEADGTFTVDFCNLFSNKKEAPCISLQRSSMNEPAVRKIVVDDLIVPFLNYVESQLKARQLYVDLDGRNDDAHIEITASFAACTTTPEAHDAAPCDIVLGQDFEKGRVINPSFVE
jgi:hypothetical protein